MDGKGILNIVLEGASKVRWVNNLSFLTDTKVALTTSVATTATGGVAVNGYSSTASELEFLIGIAATILGIILTLITIVLLVTKNIREKKEHEIKMKILNMKIKEEESIPDIEA